MKDLLAEIKDTMTFIRRFLSVFLQFHEISIVPQGGMILRKWDDCQGFWMYSGDKCAYIGAKIYTVSISCKDKGGTWKKIL